MTFPTIQENFENIPIDLVVIGAERWVRGTHIGAALGFADPKKSVKDIYTRNQREFDDSTTLVIEMPTAGGRQLVRLYNARGAALIAMKAQTPKGEAFRRWVLDVLENRANDVAGPIVASDAIPAGVIDHLQRLFIGTKHNAKLIRYLQQGLSTGECAKLLDLSHHQVRDKRRAAEFLGMAPVPPHLEERRARLGFKRLEERRDRLAKERRDKRAAELLALAAPSAGETTDGE